MNSKIWKCATDKHEGNIFGEYSNDEEVSGQIETGIDSRNRDYCAEPPNLERISICIPSLNRDQ